MNKYEGLNYDWCKKLLESFLYNLASKNNGELHHYTAWKGAFLQEHIRVYPLSILYLILKFEIERKFIKFMMTFKIKKKHINPINAPKVEKDILEAFRIIDMFCNNNEKFKLFVKNMEFLKFKIEGH